MICGQIGPGPKNASNSLKCSKHKFSSPEPLHPVCLPAFVAASSCLSQQLGYHPWLLSYPHSDNQSLSPVTCVLFISQRSFSFPSQLYILLFRSPPFDINDHTSLLTGLLLLDLPLAFLPIHFTHTLNYSINLIMSTSCLKPFFCGAPVGCPQNEIQTPFLMRSFKSGPFCFQPHVFIRSLIHACLHSLSQ